MPPKRKPAAGRKPKGKLLPAQVLPIGQLLTDLTKRGWIMGAKVGMGGCGEIFLAGPLLYYAYYNRLITFPIAPSGNSITPELATHVIKIVSTGYN